VREGYNQTQKDQQRVTSKRGIYRLQQYIRLCMWRCIN